MKLGRWGLTPEKTKACTCPAKSHDGFRRERKKWVVDPLFFCDVYDARPLSLDRFLPNFPRARVQVPSRDIWFSHSRKVSIKGSNFLKNRLFTI